MLVIDELKKNEPQLRLVALVLAAGLCVLLAGLWWVQVVSAREYQEHQTTQSSRTIRLPAVRGKILDREGHVLAENRPRYNLSLYLDEFRRPFYDSYTNLLAAARHAQKQQVAAAEKKMGRALSKAELKQFRLTTDYLEQLREDARCRVLSNTLAQVGEKLGQPVYFDSKDFNRHYASKRALPYPAIKNLNLVQIARMQEKFAVGYGVDLEMESVRSYPLGITATHLLGYLRQDDSSADGETSFFNYRLPDYCGVVGVEYGFDNYLRGRAGEESVLVNSLGYRESVSIWSHPEPGQNLVLTLDLRLQQAAEAALAKMAKKLNTEIRGAVVVMDVRNGDVLAMVSSPALDPRYYTGGLLPQEFQQESARRANMKLRPEINRATQENYAPGSTFKVIIGLAALEAGLNPEKDYLVQANPEKPSVGCYYVGRRKIDDTAPPGLYKFKRAIVRSSNSYFIEIGMDAGKERIVRLAEKFHFGERTSLPTRQETRGNLPTLERIRRGWSDGDTANLCIGQGELSVTPLQMAVAYSAVANGGKVLWPRLVARVEPQDPTQRGMVTNLPSAMIRDHLGVSARSLRILHAAMLAETEDAEGTGKEAVVPGLRICGKTGTAQVTDERNRVVDNTTWFASFAPYENPCYAVVVMVESGSSGGGTCAPIAHDIYEAILKRQNDESLKTLAVNR